MSALGIQELDAPFGAVVTGIDLRENPAGAVRERLFAALFEHALLLFRDQQLDEAEQERFGEIFGELDQRCRPVSNVVEGGLNPAGPLGFHSDTSMRPKPWRALMLYAIEVPPPGAGGDTLFADVRAAYRLLPPELKARIKDLTVRHGEPDLSKHVAMPGLRPEAPMFERPLVINHPLTLQELLFLSYRHADRILELPKDEGDALMEELASYIQRPEVRYTHVWRPGDVVVWDNVAIQHGRTDFDPKWRRHLRRVTIKA